MVEFVIVEILYVVKSEKLNIMESLRSRKSAANITFLDEVNQSSLSSENSEAESSIVVESARRGKDLMSKAMFWMKETECEEDESDAEKTMVAESSLSLTILEEHQEFPLETGTRQMMMQETADSTEDETLEELVRHQTKRLEEIIALSFLFHQWIEIQSILSPY